MRGLHIQVDSFGTLGIDIPLAECTTMASGIQCYMKRCLAHTAQRGD